MGYLDPSILRIAKQPAPQRGERATILVTTEPRLPNDYAPGQRIATRTQTISGGQRPPAGEPSWGDTVVGGTLTISTRMATVVSWHWPSGELVVDYDHVDEHRRAHSALASKGETSMHIHNVADYAPPGHRLLRTEYRDGATWHVFSTPDGDELTCAVTAGTADEERAALERFKAEWTPLESTPVPVESA